MRLHLTLLFAAAALAAGWPGHAQARRDYVLELSPETEAARARRHEQVAARRQATVVMVHRGATALAPENTLLAYARALDCAADGVEVDVRRTADGVLVLFHDAVLDRLTHGIGAVHHLAARELLALKPRSAFGRALSGSPPSFVQLLELARHRAMLLHLDLKEDGLETDVARWLEAADCWDHVVAVNSTHATNLVKDPRLRLLRYKVPGLYAQRLDLDPTAVGEALQQPGDMILVDDPRVAAQVLGREPYSPVVLSQTFRYTRPDRTTPRGTGYAGFNPVTHLDALTLRLNPDSVPQLLALLTTPAFPGEGPSPNASPPSRTASLQEQVTDQQTASRVVERAWAADRLGQLDRKTRGVVRALESLVEAPTRHPDWHYDALDAGLAARALGQLRATESAGALIAAFRRGLPIPVAAIPPAQAPLGIEWAEARFRLHLVSAMGDLRCRPVRQFLQNHFVTVAATATAPDPPFLEEATRALLRQNLAWDGIARLIRSSHPTVRGTAMLECLDWPNEERRKALAVAANWALALPRVPFGDVLPRVPAGPARPGVAAPPKHAPSIRSRKGPELTK